MEDDEMSIFNMIQTLNQKNYRQTFFKFAKKTRENLAVKRNQSRELFKSETKVKF